MKKSETLDLLDEVYHKISKDGMPINIRQGNNGEIAEWLTDVLRSIVKVDEPIGYIQHSDYKACPACGGSVGDKARYCKKCGAFIRETKDV